MVKEIIRDVDFLSKPLMKATKDDLYIINDLIDTAEEHKDNCLGLTANQIGYDKRIIVVKIDEKYIPFVNPIITQKSKETYIAEEGCPHGFTPTIHRYRMTEYKDKQRPRNIFVGSMADIFGEWVPDRWIKEVFNACMAGPQHNYLFLTKNPQRYLDLEKYKELPWADNFWFGTTITNPNQMYAWFTEKKFHWFLSIEPLLEDLGDFGGGVMPEWIIVGAETGNRKDKVVPRREWIESIVNQCRQYGIPVFMKSSLTDIWGEELIQEFPKELIHG